MWHVFIFLNGNIILYGVGCCLFANNIIVVDIDQYSIVTVRGHLWVVDGWCSLKGLLVGKACIVPRSRSSFRVCVVFRFTHKTAQYLIEYLHRYVHTYVLLSMYLHHAQEESKKYVLARSVP